MIGTGIAAAVAQTSAQSRAITSHRAKQAREKDEARKQLSSVVSEHLEAVQDGDMVELAGDAVKQDTKPATESKHASIRSHSELSDNSEHNKPVEPQEIVHLDLKA